MFQLDWFDEDKFNSSGRHEANPAVANSLLSSDDVEEIGLTFWAEHCLECAPPECYKSCSYYSARKDGRCRRTEYGQAKIEENKSILGYGSRLKFMHWSKLETKIFNRAFTMEEYGKFHGSYLKNMDRIEKLSGLNVKGFFNNLEYFYINKLLTKFPTREFKPNLFVIQMDSIHSEKYSMFIEAVTEDKRVVSRTALTVVPGFNEFRVDYNKLWPSSEKPIVLRLYPENNIGAEVLFYTLDFVKLKDSVEKKPAKKVKCVAWDLDNTLWSGILSESDLEVMPLRENVRSLIEALDEKGILQTVVSKNDFEPAWKNIEKLGLADYFLHPAINWGQKSGNLKQVADQLNINIDTFALIDDSVFEREEVRSAYPQVRVYDEKSIVSILGLPEFDVPVTEDSKKRREMYMTEGKRNAIRSSYAGDYLEFIRSCQMELNVLPVESESKKKRSYELVLRTNQLNLTGQKYSEEEFEGILGDKGRSNYSVDCWDKYGDYGTVCFISFYKKDRMLIVKEIALSCRVAKKHVEYAIFSWIAREWGSQIDRIAVDYKETAKNKPMLATLLEIGFEKDDKYMSIETEKIAADDGIIRIRTEAGL